MPPALIQIKADKLRDSRGLGLGSLYLTSEDVDVCSGKAHAPCFSKIPISLSPGLCSQNTCVHTLVFQTQESLKVPALVWLTWFRHSHSRNSSKRVGREERTTGKIPDSSSSSDFRMDCTKQESPPAKSLPSAQSSTLHHVVIPSLHLHVNVFMAVLLP